MQCKDISDDEFLEAVETAATLREMRVATIWDVQAILSGYPEHVTTDQVTRIESKDLYLPWNLIRAKARKLILKGKLDGCYCGCRGDFELKVESPRERLEREIREKKASALLELEIMAREWRIRDEIISELKSKKKALEDSWEWGEDDWVKLNRRTEVKKIDKEIEEWSTYQIVLKGQNDAPQPGDLSGPSVSGAEPETGSDVPAEPGSD